MLLITKQLQQERNVSAKRLVLECLECFVYNSSILGWMLFPQTSEWGLFGSKFFEVKLGKLKWGHAGWVWALNPLWQVSWDRETETGRTPGRDWEETFPNWGHQGSPATTSHRKTGQDPSPQPLEESRPAAPGFHTCSPQNSEERIYISVVLSHWVYGDLL